MIEAKAAPEISRAARTKDNGSQETKGCLREAMKWFAAGLLALLPMFCQACYAAQKTIEFFDKTFDRQPCSRKITFDPKTYDETQIRNTADFLGYPGEFPLPQAYLKPGDLGVDEFKNASRHHSHSAASFRSDSSAGLRTD